MLTTGKSRDIDWKQNLCKYYCFDKYMQGKVPSFGNEMSAPHNCFSISRQDT